MKAERRHELQTNSLAVLLFRLTEAFRKHGSKIVLGAVIVLLVIALIYQRIAMRRAAREESRVMVARAWDTVQQLQQLARQMGPAEQLSSQRDLLVSTIAEAIQIAAAQTDESPVLVNALLAKAEMNWQLANMPPLPEATTRPELGLKEPPEQYLQEAENNYRQVIDKFPDQRHAVAQAYLGLAAIAENRRNWTEAEGHYRQVEQMTDVPEFYHIIARQKIKDLPLLQQPIYIATPEPEESSQTQPTSATTDTATTLPAASEAVPTTQSTAAQMTLPQ